MRRVMPGMALLWTTLACGGIVVMPDGAGGEGGEAAQGGQSEGGQGGAPQCTPETLATDCGVDSECMTFACVAGACESLNAEDGGPCHDGGEICVDGTCAPTSCGDSFVSSGEACDDGNMVTGDGCGSGCRRIVSMAKGNSRTCALLDDGTVKCWGYNGSGALGLGDTSNRGDSPGEMGDLLVPLLLP